MSAPSGPCYSDVDDPTWALIAPILAQPRGRGRPRVHADRLIYNAILYVLRGGIPWRMLPASFPPWRTVYSRFRRWADSGAWEALTDALRAELRLELGREPDPSAGILDSQSVPTGPGSGAIGYDAGKKVKGRKRHLVVDTQGTVLAALVTPANVQDPLAAPDLLARARAKSARLQRLWADGRYQGPLVQRAAQALGLTIEVVSPPPGQRGFRVLPRRWVVETTRTHYPTNASVDNQPAVGDHRGHRAAQPRGARRDQTRRRALRPRRRWSLVSAPATVAVPPRPKRVSCSVAGGASRRPIANACSGS